MGTVIKVFNFNDTTIGTLFAQSRHYQIIWNARDDKRSGFEKDLAIFKLQLANVEDNYCVKSG